MKILWLFLESIAGENVCEGNIWCFNPGEGVKLHRNIGKREKIPEFCNFTQNFVSFSWKHRFLSSGGKKRTKRCFENAKNGSKSASSVASINSNAQIHLRQRLKSIYCQRVLLQSQSSIQNIKLSVQKRHKIHSINSPLRKSIKTNFIQLNLSVTISTQPHFTHHNSVSFWDPLSITN